MLVQYASQNTQESQFSLSPSIWEFENESGHCSRCYFSVWGSIISDAGALLEGEPASDRLGSQLQEKYQSLILESPDFY